MFTYSHEQTLVFSPFSLWDAYMDVGGRVKQEHLPRRLGWGLFDDTLTPALGFSFLRRPTDYFPVIVSQREREHKQWLYFYSRLLLITAYLKLLFWLKSQLSKYQKKCPTIGRATRWNRIGDAGSDDPQKGESGSTPGYSVFTKEVFNVAREITHKIKTTSLILIKDYTEEMSKGYRQKAEKVGWKPTNG